MPSRNVRRVAEQLHEVDAREQRGQPADALQAGDPLDLVAVQAEPLDGDLAHQNGAPRVEREDERGDQEGAEVCPSLDFAHGRLRKARYGHPINPRSV